MGALNIAVIISGIDEEYQSTILSGIHEFAEEKNINIVHFIAFGGVLGNHNDIGEFNIYNLINYDILDGVILLTNTIASPAVVKEIVDRIRESDTHIPVASIDCDMEGFCYVGIDNSRAMEEMVRHIVEDHGVRKVNYITGPDANPESIMRFNAYKKVLAENDIEYDERYVYHGLFRERDGVSGVEEFIRNGVLGQAVICANDVMAIGALNTLKEHGYHIPEDVMVTGFDNIFNARNYYTPITSVDRPLKKSGYIACEQVYNGIMGIPQERSVILETSVCRNMSCGCHDAECDDIMIFKKETYDIMEIYHRDVPGVNSMSCILAESDDFNQNIESLKSYVEQMNCEKFFLCLCENWLDESENPGTQGYLSHGYTENVEVPLAYCDKQFGKLSKFPSSQILSDLKYKTPHSKKYYFSPIHFNDRCLGYSVICNSDFPLRSPMYHAWIISLSNSLENIRKKLCLEKVLSKLEALYIYDPLTQIYNRNGFYENIAKFYSDVSDNKPAMIMFADMDGMKYINDNFGHKEGDSAIKGMAESIGESCIDDEVFARFGGDEFIIFGYDYDEEKAEKLRSRIHENIDKYNDASEKPYKIGTSIGWHIETLGADKDFNALITKADLKMYREKRNKSTSREGRQRMGLD